MQEESLCREQAVYARLLARTSKGGSDGLADSQERSAAIELTLEDGGWCPNVIQCAPPVTAEVFQEAETQPAGSHFQTVILIKLLVMDLPQQAGGEWLSGWKCSKETSHSSHVQPCRFASFCTSWAGMKQMACAASYVCSIRSTVKTNILSDLPTRPPSWK